jgi:hypothetical protein
MTIFFIVFASPIDFGERDFERVLADVMMERKSDCRPENIQTVDQTTYLFLLYFPAAAKQR